MSADILPPLVLPPLRYAPQGGSLRSELVPSGPRTVARFARTAALTGYDRWRHPVEPDHSPSSDNHGVHQALVSGGATRPGASRMNPSHEPQANRRQTTHPRSANGRPRTSHAPQPTANAGETHPVPPQTSPVLGLGPYLATHIPGPPTVLDNGCGSRSHRNSVRAFPLPSCRGSPAALRVLLVCPAAAPHPWCALVRLSR